MAESTLLLRLRWENGIHFTLSSKIGEEPYIDVVSMKEDAETSTIWGGIQASCISYMQKKLTDIGKEMVQP